MLTVGTCGYRHREWVPGFYDPELPDDWRFLHYSNQLRSILLPWEEMVRDRDALVADSDDDFRFVARVAADGLHRAVTDRAIGDGFGVRLAAFLVAADAPGEAHFRDRDWCAALARLAVTRPVCVDAAIGPRGCGDDARAVCRSLGGALAWRPERDAEPAPGGRFLATLVGVMELDAIRGVLAKAAAWAGDEGDAGVFFEAPADAASRACDTRILAEMMGF